MLQVRLIAVAVVAFLLAGAGWMARGWQADADIWQLKEEHARDLKAISDKATEAAETARQQEENWQAKVAELDRKHSEEMQNAKQENDRLRAAVDDGAVRLRVRASCPASSGNMPNSTAAAGKPDGASVELDASARPDYFALRSGIEADREKIIGLQRYITDVCQAPAK